ncbi:MAG: sigma-70 family RNA polymerase sigma factor [Elusimicrobia bacterium]|nr:sigma-70 family RNA polymerase sigma factor [Elusimicrobiota bacterium]
MGLDSNQDRRFSELMRSAQDGDNAAYEILLKEVSAILRGFITARIGARDAAEDVLQEVLLSMHKARHSYDPVRPFAPWMFAIGEHRLADHWRRSRRLAERETTLEDDLDHFLAPNEDDMGLSDELSSALSGLPEKQRQVIVLLKLEGLSIKEAASKLGISESDVKVSAHRGYEALRRKFKA